MVKFLYMMFKSKLGSVSMRSHHIRVFLYIHSYLLVHRQLFRRNQIYIPLIYFS